MRNKIPKTITKEELREFCHGHSVEFERFCTNSLKPDACGIKNCSCPMMGDKFVCAQQQIAHDDELVFDWHIRFIREE